MGKKKKIEQLTDEQIVQAISDAETGKIPIETCVLCKIKARNGLYFCGKCRDTVLFRTLKYELEKNKEE